MSRVYILVEGQSEEAFVKELLVPHYSQSGLFLTPIIVSTSPGFKGGVVSYAKVKIQILRLCKQDSAAWVTTMFDLYALPGGFPGQASTTYPSHGRGSEKATFLETEMANDIAQANFIPNLMVHEFEALLFSAPAAFGEWTDDTSIVHAFQACVNACGSPEDINNSPLTAPSKRILSKMPEYQKTFHGPLIACEIGIAPMRGQCRHFDGWLRKLESL